MMARSPVDVANEHIFIGQILFQMGVYVPDSSSGESWKANCPFEDFYHIDRGRSKSLRVYFSSNSAFCFAGCGYLTPVTLYSLKTGLSKSEAALFLLQSNGVQLPSLDDELQSLFMPHAVSKASLREALQIFCHKKTGSDWKIIQFNDVVLTGMDNCLKLLNLVQDEDTAKTWLEKSKQYMSALLKGITNVEI